MMADTEIPAPILHTGHNCWRIARCERATVIVDAADYFRLAREAMLRARHQILLIGWDFDTRIRLDPECEDDGPATLGAFLSWLSKCRPALKIYILKWDLGAIKLLGRGTTILRLAQWASSDRISFKLDSAHPPGASHHQKILVVDDALAFCGGIDMTADRWDTRGHRDHDDRRKRPTTRRHYGPWHDATMAVDGAAAHMLGELARERWKLAGGKAIVAPPTGSDPWPPELRAHFTEVDVAIARTRGAHKDVIAIREIEALFIDSIRRAKRSVYAENQYFASRAVAEVIAERLKEPEGPEFVLVNPRSGHGWLDEEVMGPARACLLSLLRDADRYRRFRIYTPVTAAKDHIYVHSKIMIIDNRMLRIGSANLNNRSMGLDSECDLAIEAFSGADAQLESKIAAIRCDLIAEHLAITAEEVRAQLDRCGSLIDTIETLRGPGRTLLPFEPAEPNRVERLLAESEALDPESVGKSFEPLARPGLVTRLRRLVGHGVPAPPC